jgi:hypothetical protein
VCTRQQQSDHELWRTSKSVTLEAKNHSLQLPLRRLEPVPSLSRRGLDGAQSQQAEHCDRRYNRNP